jgi:OOP family OmpA-OmpF porin
MWLFVGRKFYGLGIKDKARIDELFLLHRSGELIRHHSRSLRVDVDSDVLSAMLVAVQNFVKESFNFRAGDLEELKFGDQKIMLIHGEHVILAAVVAGPFPQRLEPGMRDGIESRFGSSLEDWSGITEDLPEVDDILSGVFDAKA